jgi:nucleoprotein TPR
MAAEVDVHAVATFSSTPESTISTILENPTVQLVRSLLYNISVRAKEYDQLKSQKVRLEVELETVVRTSESKVKVLKNSVEKGLTEITRLRTELQNSGKLPWRFWKCVANMIRKCSYQGGTGSGADTVYQLSRRR